MSKWDDPPSGAPSEATIHFSIWGKAPSPFGTSPKKIHGLNVVFLNRIPRKNGGVLLKNHKNKGRSTGKTKKCLEKNGRGFRTFRVFILQNFARKIWKGMDFTTQTFALA